jgi:membrane associated rhomboid family serine protease
VIPLQDRTPTRGYPIVTRLLLGINVAVWIYVLYLSRTPGALEAFYRSWAFDPESFSSVLVPGNLGIETPLRFVTLVTHLFIHGGWLHIIGNMLYLWIFGDKVENALGSAAFLMFYVACGFVAALGQALFTADPLIGASGAIAGVLGAYLLMFPTARIATLVFLGIFITIIDLPAIIVIGLFILTQVIEGIADLRFAVPEARHIAYFAHVFGFLAGMLLMPVLRGRSSSRRTKVGWG